MTYRFVLPLPPVNLANSRMHWRAKHSEQKNYSEALGVILRTGHSLRYPGRRDFSIPIPPTEPHHRILATATMYIWGRMDEGNALNRLKWVEDWIVRAGYVTDDSPEHWRWAGIPEQVIDRKRPRVELTLTPVPRIVA